MHSDRVKETSTTTGTGNLTLAGAVTQFQSLNSRIAVGVPFYYTIALGTEWEIGIGQLSDATTLVRSQVLSSSNADALVSFSAGTKDVFNAAPAFFVNRTDAELNRLMYAGNPGGSL